MKRSSLWYKFSCFIFLAFCRFSASPVFSETPEMPGGCIDKDVHICLRNLDVGFKPTRASDVEGQIKRNAEVDINGKRIMAGNSLVIVGAIKGSDRSSTISLMYSDDNIIERAEISLPIDPTDAHTLKEYEKSGVLTAVALMIGSNCPAATGNALYKFIENELKPRIVHYDKREDFGNDGLETSYLQSSPPIDICTWKVAYKNIMGYDTNLITDRNPHGVFRSTTLTFGH